MSPGTSKVIAGITTSVDGYITGPDDGPEHGLGIGGERLHNWVMGGPWTYDGEHAFEMSAEDREFYDEFVAGIGSGLCGRGMYDASGAWGGRNPFGGTLHVVTHRTEDAPDPSTGFRFVDGFEQALELAREAAGEQDVAIAGGADMIRQGLAGGHIDVLEISTAPLILGQGKRLFEGFEQDIDLEKISVYSSQWATHTTYAVKR
jgi:dihydrofolate reductase